MHPFSTGALVLLASILTGCALPPATPPSLLEKSTRVFNANDKMAWESVSFPGKVRTAFSQQRHDGRDSVQADAKGSVSMLRQRLRVPSDDLGQLNFSWQVETLLPGADMAEPGRGDSPVRLVLAFEGDRQTFSARNAMLSELSHALTGEPLPYATLMYVWSNRHPVGTVIVHPRTDRIRKIVVDSGPQHLRQWRHHQRDLRADFERAFGEAPGALQALAIMTDSDNTRSQTRAWYGQIRLSEPLNPPSHALR
jgi:hypothetical protein